MPVRKTEYSAGYDIRTAQEVLLEPNVLILAHTGLWIVEAIQPGFHLEIRPRSSLSKQGVQVVLGTVDADYRDEILVQLFYWAIPHISYLPNTKDDRELWNRFDVANPKSKKIEAGTRIAQLVVAHTFPLIDCVEEKTQREGGFGSTGVD